MGIVAVVAIVRLTVFLIPPTDSFFVFNNFVIFTIVVAPRVLLVCIVVDFADGLVRGSRLCTVESNAPLRGDAIFFFFSLVSYIFI